MSNTRSKQQQQQEEESDQVYTIERIIEKRVSTETGRLEYLVRWAGYDESGDTWEDAEKLKGFTCVKEFEASEKKVAAKRASRGSGMGVKVRRASAAIIGEKKTAATTAVAKRKSQPATVSNKTRATPASDSAKVPGSSSAKSAPKVKTIPTKTIEKPSPKNATDQVAAVPEKVPTAPMNREKKTGSKTKEDALQADNSILDMPIPGKRYRIQDGLLMKEILAVTKHADGPVAMVQYTDSSFEIVPTKVLAEQLSSAQLLIDYYESRLAVLN